MQIDLSLGIPKSVLFHDQNYAPQAQLDSVYKRVQFESVSLLKVSTMVRYREFFWAAHHSSMEIICGSNTLWGFHDISRFSSGTHAKLFRCAVFFPDPTTDFWGCFGKLLVSPWG